MNNKPRFPLIRLHEAMFRLALFLTLLSWVFPATATSYTGWPLEGVHLTQPCSKCHKNNAFKGTPSDCYSCHQNDYNTAKSPVDHVASRYPTTCDSCHKFSDATWMKASFSHTTFPLVGVHATTACTVCHNPPYAPSANNTTTVPTTCYGCHVRDFTGATSPVPHTGFPTTCDSCHKNTDATWSQKSAFVHNTYFALAGAHATAPCSQCHNPPYAPSPNNYTSVPTTPCSGCHMNDYNTAKSPVDHIASRYPTTCDSCHKFSDATWMQASFSHTTFPLVGVHATTACTVCHNPPYAPSANNTTTVPTTCYGCHVRDFTGATSPVPHTGFPTTCDSCHKNTDATWSQKSAFVHNTYFALAGAHATAPCSQCHNPPYAPSPNNYTSVPTTPCSACHQTDYNNAKSPVDHIASNFPNTCDSCHKFSDATWSQATFSHTTFPLVGRHATTPCATCHNPPYAPSANNYTTVPMTCYGCHVRDFTGATSPVPHTGFPTTCDSCHKNTDATWSQKGAFVHNTYFALVGAHTTAPCSQCHNPPYAPSANNYTTVPTTCYGCHVRDFTGATSPVPHTGFATTCDSCHRNSDATWSQKSAFLHNTYFALAGAHATAPCSQCHNPPYAPSPNNYLNVPTTPCAACHLRDYNTATTPVNHIAAGFPTTCDTCHKFSDATWLQGTFNHTWFPIASGRHAVPCAQCHTTPNVYTLFNCTICHTAAETNSHHTGVRGYVWTSTACYSCHPNGRAG